MKCPFCSKENPEGTIKCECGYQFKGYSEAGPESNFQSSTTGQRGGFWAFDKMITIQIIPMAFIIALLFNVVLSGTWSYAIFSLLSISAGKETATFVAVLVFVLSNIFLFVITRIVLELLIVVFKIWENLNALRLKR